MLSVESNLVLDDTFAGGLGTRWAGAGLFEGPRSREMPFITRLLRRDRQALPAEAQMRCAEQCKCHVLGDVRQQDMRIDGNVKRAELLRGACIQRAGSLVCIIPVAFTRIVEDVLVKTSRRLGSAY